jgi:hypothetical protein
MTRDLVEVHERSLIWANLCHGLYWIYKLVYIAVALKKYRIPFRYRMNIRVFLEGERNNRPHKYLDAHESETLSNSSSSSSDAVRRGASTSTATSSALDTMSSNSIASSVWVLASPIDAAE